MAKTKPLFIRTGNTSGGVSWVESFIFSGTSAMLLLMAGLFPDYWYLSFIALTPFLYRMVRASIGEAVRLGFLLGLTYLAVQGIDSLLVNPLGAMLRIGAGTAMFSLFGLAVGLARHRWGFNPALIALLWVAFELGITKAGYAGGLLYGVEVSYPFFHGVAILFGFLIVSCIIILCSSVLALAIEKVIALGGVHRKAASTMRRIYAIIPTIGFTSQRVFLVPEVRGPPSFLP